MIVSSRYLILMTTQSHSCGPLGSTAGTNALKLVEAQGGGHVFLSVSVCQQTFKPASCQSQTGFSHKLQL